jgi:phage recombination protein Bet
VNQKAQHQPQQGVTLQETDSEFVKLITGRKVSYIPQGETAPIEMSVELVKRYLVRPTRSGAMPSDQDVTKFVMLCKARELNPWVGDAFLVGYDGKDGPEFSLITSVHALHKRADRCPEYDGMTAGVIIRDEDGVHEVSGTCYHDKAALIGGWAIVRRKDRSEPYYVSLRLAAYDKGRSLWSTDKAGMIRKCAVAAALREAFPNQTSGLYTTDELPAMMASATAKPSEDKAIDKREQSERYREAKADLDRLLDRQAAKHEPEQDPIDTPEPPLDPIRECLDAIAALDAPAPKELIQQAMELGLDGELDTKIKTLKGKR